MALDARRLKTVEQCIWHRGRGLLLADILPPWLLDLNLLVERSKPAARRARRPIGSPAW